MIASVTFGKQLTAKTRQISLCGATVEAGYKCVSRHAPKGSRVKWQAYIGLNRKRHSLGYFDTPGSAALASTITAEKHFGEFSRPTLEDTCVSIFMDAWRDARWKFDWVRV
jgi:hypothetical protein